MWKRKRLCSKGEACFSRIKNPMSFSSFGLHLLLDLQERNSGTVYDRQIGRFRCVQTHKSMVQDVDPLAYSGQAHPSLILSKALRKEDTSCVKRLLILLVLSTVASLGAVIYLAERALPRVRSPPRPPRSYR